MHIIGFLILLPFFIILICLADDDWGKSKCKYKSCGCKKPPKNPTTVRPSRPLDRGGSSYQELDLPDYHQY